MKIESKSRAFLHALNQYKHKRRYRYLNRIFSFAVVGLQIITAFNCYRALTDSESHLNYLGMIGASLTSYILADLVNGLIHMYMDNNDNYDSFFGPFIANFHMHHKKLKYSYVHAWQVYFFESGYKIWLPFFLCLLALLQINDLLGPYVNFILTAFGIISSFAEVSHYWCHNATKDKPVISQLQKLRILLPMSHHKVHHQQDNTHYAFLNGCTDPIINKIAQHVFPGYKNTTDRHVNESKV